MMLIELTPVPQEALPVAGFKAHLRLGSGFADDALEDAVLETYLRAALAAIEARTGKVLIEREFAWTLGRWRDADRQPLPMAPVSALIRLVRIDRVGTETEIDLAGVALAPDSQRPAIVALGAALPTLSTGMQMRIEVLAGYGPDWGDLPADLAQAVMLLAAHYYEYRHSPALGGLPHSVAALIERYRTVRLMMGGPA